MEVICINDTFAPDQLSFWLKHGAKHPVEGNIYHIRDTRKHTTGEVSVYLTEFDDNPLVPIMHPILGVQMMEVGFSKDRFTTLLGDSIDLERVKQTTLI